jgi:hypothetical protein
MMRQRPVDGFDSFAPTSPAWLKAGSSCPVVAGEKSTTRRFARFHRGDRGQQLVFLLAICHVFTSVAWQSLFARDRHEPPVSALSPANDREWLVMTARILDSDGNPVAGASVRPTAFNLENGWYLQWPDQGSPFGERRRTVSDADGNVEVRFPQSVKVQKLLRVVDGSAVIVHPDFCSKGFTFRRQLDKPQQVCDVKLERGVRLRIAGVAPGNSEPLSHCHVLLEGGDTAEPEFVAEPDGWLQSMTVTDERRWFRVVRAVPGKPPEFSKSSAWPSDDPRSRTAQVEIHPGVRVTGKLSDNVARPILRGHVLACCGSHVHHNDEGVVQVRQPFFWYETVPITEEGTFEFASLPAGYLGQFYAFANDSISAQPSLAAFETCRHWFGVQDLMQEPAYRYGQILRLAGTRSAITLEMETACEVQFKCTSSAGKPLAGIEIQACPNQWTCGLSTTVFCTYSSSLDQLLGVPADESPARRPFNVKTNEDGEAVIRNLPRGLHYYAAGSGWTTGDGWNMGNPKILNATPNRTAIVKVRLKQALK